MIELFIQTLATGLSLWEHKEKHKYADKLMELRSMFYNEYNKDPSERSDAILDGLEFELRNLAAGFNTSVREPNSKS